MASKRLVAGLVLVSLLSGCSGGNTYEGRADTVISSLEKGSSLSKLSDYLVTKDGEFADNSTLYLSEFYFNNTELDEDILKILLDGLDITDKEYDRSTESEGYILVKAKYKGKDWDSYFNIGLVNYMKSKGEYKSSCDLGDGSGLYVKGNRDEYINALKSMADKVPVVEGVMEFTVNKVGEEYVIGSRNMSILDSLNIGNTYHSFSQIVSSITDAGGIVTDSNEKDAPKVLKTLMNYISTYNSMIDSKSLDFNKLYNSLLGMEDSFGTKSDTLLEGYAKDNIDWYNSLDGKSKKKVDDLIYKKGKLDYSLYNVYESNDNCSKGKLNAVNLAFTAGGTSIVVNEYTGVSSVWQLFSDLESIRYSLDFM